MGLVRVGPVSVGEDHPLVLISGPCVVEAVEVMRHTAGRLSEICDAAGIPLIFKSSFEKDNRTEASAHRGPGLERGLDILGRLKREFGFPVTTDVHRETDVPLVAKAVDLVQIPALLCRQSSLLEAAARSGVPLNIKKGQFASGRTMAGAVEKIRRAGGSDVQVMLTERGSCFGRDQIVCDLTELQTLEYLGCPVVMDASHASNTRDQIPLLARCGVAAGADALFLECHPDPDVAPCDGQRMLSLDDLEFMLPGLVRLAKLVRELEE